MRFYFRDISPSMHGQIEQATIPPPVPAHGFVSKRRDLEAFRNMATVGDGVLIRPRNNLHAWNREVEEGRTDLVPLGTPVYSVEDLHKSFSSSAGGKETPKKPPSLCLRVLNYFDFYCDNSTLHGLKYVGDNKLPAFERIFWLVAFVGAVSFAIYFIAQLYDKYNVNPVIVSFTPSLLVIDEVPFPSITICNVNLALKSRVQQVMKNGTDLEKQLLGEMCNQEIEHGPVKGPINWTTMRNFIVSINQNCNDMFKVCIWQGDPANCDLLVNSILTDEGYCCAFNKLPSNYSLKNPGDEDLNQTYPENKVDWNPQYGYNGQLTKDMYPLRAGGAGVQLGFTVVMDAGLDEYYCTSTNSLGFKFVFSNPIEAPKVADYGMLISPGTESRISINPVMNEATSGIEGIDVQKRQCFFTHERFLANYRSYSERNCRLECQANYTLNKCGCVPYFLPKNFSTRICNKEKEQCADEAKDINSLTVTSEKLGKERKICNCLPGCFELTYRVEQKSWGLLSKSSSFERYNFTDDISKDYIVKNMAIAHFFYSREKFTKQRKSELYGFSEFLSNTGGLLGLFMGFSFLSAVEIFYFFVLRSTCGACRAEKRKFKAKHPKIWSLPFVK